MTDTAKISQEDARDEVSVGKPPVTVSKYSHTTRDHTVYQSENAGSQTVPQEKISVTHCA